MTSSLELLKDLVADTAEHDFGLDSIGKHDKFESLCEQIVAEKCLELSHEQKEVLFAAWKDFVLCATTTPLDEIRLGYSVFQLHDLLNNNLQKNFEHDEIIISAQRVLEFGRQDLKDAAQIIVDKKETPNDPLFIQAAKLLYPKEHFSIELERNELIANSPNNLEQLAEIEEKIVNKKNKITFNLAENILKINKAGEAAQQAARTILANQDNPQSEAFTSSASQLYEKSLAYSVSEYVRSTDRDSTFEMLNNSCHLDLSQEQAANLQNVYDRFTSLQNLPPPSSLNQADANKYIENIATVATVGATLRKILEKPSVKIRDIENNHDYFDNLPSLESAPLFSPLLFLNALYKEDGTFASEQECLEQAAQITNSLRSNAAEKSYWDKNILHKQAFLIATECANYLVKPSIKKTHKALASETHKEIYKILKDEKLSTVEQAIKIVEFTNKILKNQDPALAPLKQSINDFRKWLLGENVSVKAFKESIDYYYLASDHLKEQQPEKNSIYTELLKQERPSTKQTYLLSFLDERNLYEWALNGLINNCVLYLIYHPYPTLKHDGQEFVFQWLTSIYQTLNAELDEQGNEVNTSPPISRLCDIYKYALDKFDKTKGEIYENIIAPLEDLLFGKKLEGNNQDKLQTLNNFKNSPVYLKLTEQPIQTIPLPKGANDGIKLGHYKKQLLEQHRQAINKPIEFYLKYNNISDLNDLDAQQKIEFRNEQKTRLHQMFELGRKVFNFLFRTNIKVWGLAKEEGVISEDSSIKPNIKFENIATVIAKRYNSSVEGVLEQCRGLGNNNGEASLVQHVRA